MHIQNSVKLNMIFWGAVGEIKEATHEPHFNLNLR